MTRECPQDQPNLPEPASPIQARRDEGDTRLGEVIEAMAELATTADDPLDAVLRKIADLARRLARAQYAAVGVPGPDGYLERFVAVGISQEEIDAIGHWPRGHGLLGALIHEERIIRLADLTRDPRSSGFPPHHPVMTSFLGVPILYNGKALGSLYITNKQGAAGFSAEDQHIIEALAAHAAVAIQNVGLVTSLRQLSETREEEIRLISHDLRAPLTIILGQAQILSRLVTTGSQGAALTACEAIVKGARRMNGLIQDLVDAARLESGRIELEHEPIDLAALVADLRARLTGALSAERIQIQAGPGVPLAWADPARLERVLMNLLTNALKYSSPDSPVLVRVELTESGDVLAAVADQGVGFAADELPHLFERFYRTREAGSAEGLGLGLYISRRLVEAHGGRLWAESPGPGRGATFRFTLPGISPKMREGAAGYR